MAVTVKGRFLSARLASERMIVSKNTMDVVCAVHRWIKKIDRISRRDHAEVQTRMIAISVRKKQSANFNRCDQNTTTSHLTFGRFFCVCFFRRARSNCASVFTLLASGSTNRPASGSSSTSDLSSSRSSSSTSSSRGRFVLLCLARVKHATKNPLVLSSGRQRMTESAISKLGQMAMTAWQRTSISTHLSGPTSPFPRRNDGLSRC